METFTCLTNDEAWQKHMRGSGTLKHGDSADRSSQNRGATRVSQIQKNPWPCWKGTWRVSKSGPALLEGNLDSVKRWSCPPGKDLSADRSSQNSRATGISKIKTMAWPCWKGAWIVSMPSWKGFSKGQRNAEQEGNLRVHLGMTPRLVRAKGWDGGRERESRSLLLLHLNPCASRE